MNDLVTGVESVIAKYKRDRSALIQILLEIQSQNRWLPREAIYQVSRRLGVPLTHIYHIATFYKTFSLNPKGRHLVSICVGTACQVRGAPQLLDRVTQSLKIQQGATTDDNRFSLDTVNCLGCCALGPVMVVDDKYYSNPSTKELEQIFNACE